MPTRTHLSVAAIVLLCVVGVWMVLFTTSHSVGIDSDAISYIDAARHLANGFGLFTGSPDDLRPFVHWPPLFPAVLGSMQVYGLDPVDGARWLNAFLFGATILVVGGALLIYTSGSPIPSIFGAALTLATQSVLSTYCVARSEPLFIFFGTAGLVGLSAYLSPSATSPRPAGAGSGPSGKPKPILLVVSILCVAMAFMDRYVGVTLVGVGAVALLIWGTGTRLTRLRDAAIFTVGGCLPMALWMARNAHCVHSAVGSTGRALGFHPVPGEEVQRGLMTFADWAFPGITLEQPWLAAFFVAFTAVVLLIVLAVWKGGLGNSEFGIRNSEYSAIRIPHSAFRRPLRRLPYVMAAFVPVYVLFVVATITFIDILTPLSDRILLPAYVAGLIVVLCAVHRRLALAASARTRDRLRALAASGGRDVRPSPVSPDEALAGSLGSLPAIPFGGPAEARLRRAGGPMRPAALAASAARAVLGSLGETRVPGWALMAAFLLVGCALLIADASKTGHWIQNARANGIERIDTVGRRPDGIIHHLKALPGNPLIYTNGGAAVHFLLGTYNTRQFPTTRAVGTGVENRRFSREVAVLKRDMEKQNTLLVYIDDYRFRDYFADEKDLAPYIPLRLVDTALDGVIYDLDRRVQK